MCEGHVVTTDKAVQAPQTEPLAQSSRPIMPLAGNSTDKLVLWESLTFFESRIGAVEAENVES